MVERWGAEEMVIHNEIVYPANFPGFAIFDGQDLQGLVTYRISGRSCEVTSLDSFIENTGIGTALLAAVEDAARKAGCSRVFLVTTNDNLNALRFYQKRGYRLSALRPGAVIESRRLKPQIPELGENGIPLRDELELEKIL